MECKNCVRLRNQLQEANIGLSLREGDLEEMEQLLEIAADGIPMDSDLWAGMKSERDNLAKSLFRIRELTIRGRGDSRVAKIACDAVECIDETTLRATNL